jgi:hypothetical protein
MAKNKKYGSLTIKKLPHELLRLVNAKAELSHLSQPEFVIECLEDATEDLRPVRERIKREREAKKKRSAPNDQSSL